MFTLNDNIIMIKVEENNSEDYRDLFEDIKGEIEEFGLNYMYFIPKNISSSPIKYTYDFFSFRIVLNNKLFFDFMVQPLKNSIQIPSYTNKRLTDNSETTSYNLSMANIDEILLAIKSYENIYIPQLQ